MDVYGVWSQVLSGQKLLPYELQHLPWKNTIIINNPSVDFTTHTLLVAEDDNNEAMSAENRVAVNPFHFSRPAGQWVSVTNTAASLHADNRSQAMHMYVFLCVSVCFYVCVCGVIRERESEHRWVRRESSLCRSVLNCTRASFCRCGLKDFRTPDSPNKQTWEEISTKEKAVFSLTSTPLNLQHNSNCCQLGRIQKVFLPIKRLGRPQWHQF